jgi:dephospho-CoA kinase
VLIGLTGPNAAGKGEAARVLRDSGLPVHSLSDVVREEARRLGRGVGRDALILTGQELRIAEGPGVLAERLLPRLEPDAVVDSIRHPEEVRVLRRRPDFILVGIDAPIDVRWQRARLRGREGDAVELAAFRLQEERENADRPESQQLRRTLALADRVMVNEGRLETLRAGVLRLLEELRGGLTARESSS